MALRSSRSRPPDRDRWVAPTRLARRIRSLRLDVEQPRYLRRRHARVQPLVLPRGSITRLAGVAYDCFDDTYAWEVGTNPRSPWSTRERACASGVRDDFQRRQQSAGGRHVVTRRHLELPLAIGLIDEQEANQATQAGGCDGIGTKYCVANPNRRFPRTSPPRAPRAREQAT